MLATPKSLKCSSVQVFSIQVFVDTNQGTALISGLSLNDCYLNQSNKDSDNSFNDAIRFSISSSTIKDVLSSA